MTTNNAIGILKNKLQSLLLSIPEGSTIYYLDYPVHENIGDLLILKGTEQFFKDYQINVKARYSVLNFPENHAIPRDTIIVLHGGGNFGNLYRIHQQFREKIIQAYPHNRIVILPQTVYFTNNKSQQHSMNILNKHQDLHIYGRDSESFIKLKGFSDKIFLLPDMAHQLYPLASTSPPTEETLYLLRTDKEKKTNFKGNRELDVMDWSALLTSEDQHNVAQIRRNHFQSVRNKNTASVQESWYEFTNYLIDKAISLFSKYESIYTSRLHGHILACLMDKNNTLQDNTYGKNSSYYKTWTQHVPLADLEDY